MYATRKSRSALARIHEAIQAGFGYYADAPDAGGGGGADDPPPAKKSDKPNEPEKLSLTQAEMDAKVSAALTEQQRKADAKAAKDKADAEAEEAKKRGEFEKVADKERERADLAEAENKALKRGLALRAHLDEHKPELAKAHPVIVKLIAAGNDDEPAAIKAAVAEYEKTLPETKGGGAPTPLPRTGNRASAAGAGDAPRKDRNALPNGNRIHTPASRF